MLGRCLTRERGGLAQPLAIIERCKRVVKFAGKPAKPTWILRICSTITRYCSVKLLLQGRRGDDLSLPGKASKPGINPDYCTMPQEEGAVYTLCSPGGTMPSLVWSTFPMRGPMEDPASFAESPGSAAACCSSSALKNWAFAASPKRSFALKIAWSSALSIKELLPPTNLPKTSCCPVKVGSSAWRLAAVRGCCPGSLVC